MVQLSIEVVVKLCGIYYILYSYELERLRPAILSGPVDGNRQAAGIVSEYVKTCPFISVFSTESLNRVCSNFLNMLEGRMNIMS